MGNGVYKITSVKSGRVLDVYNGTTANGGKIDLWDWWNNDYQKWYVQRVGTNGDVKIISRYNGKALDLLNGSTANGATVAQWDEGSGNMQRWVVSAP